MRVETKAATAVSRKMDGLQALEEACEKALARSQVDCADWALLFASMHYFPDYARMLKRAKEILGTSCIVGCSAAGILTEEGEVNEGSALGLLTVSSNECPITPFLVTELKSRSREAAQEILALAPKDARALIIFPDIFHLDSAPFFEEFQKYNQSCEKPLQIVGGSASSENPTHGTVQFCGENFAQGAISGFFLKGSFSPHVGVSQACHPVTPSFTVTACEGQWIAELDGKPAFHVLRDNIPEPMLQDLERLLNYVSIAVSVDENLPMQAGNYLIRNIAGIDATTQVIACGGMVEEGMKICFALRNCDTAREHLKAVLENLKTELNGNPPHFGIYFNCCARGQTLYGLSDIDTSYITQAFQKFPLLGLASFAEIGPVAKIYDLQAYTGILMLA